MKLKSTILVVKVEDPIVMVGDPLRHKSKHPATRVRRVNYF